MFGSKCFFLSLSVDLQYFQVFTDNFDFHGTVERYKAHRVDKKTFHHIQVSAADPRKNCLTRTPLQKITPLHLKIKIIRDNLEVLKIYREKKNIWNQTYNIRKQETHKLNTAEYGHYCSKNITFASHGR
jgi:hypothetical protein